MERIEGELSDAQKRIAELEYLLARQAKAAQQGMDAAKAVASSELEQAKRLHAECNPRALESEREANARLTELVAQLEQERDAYRTAEEHQIALRQKIEQERDALAAHVERLVVAANDAVDQPRSCMMVAQWESAVKDAPASSLARRDARMKSEALHNAVCVLESEFDPCHPIIERVESLEAELRRQAEGGWQAKPTRQYYYKTNGCKAPSPDSDQCICWHYEGEGPLADGSSKLWRDIPTEPAEQPRELCQECGGNGDGRTHEDDCSQQIKPDEQKEPIYLTDSDILAVASNVETSPVLLWWLKDDVAISDVQAAVLRFARALLVFK